MSGAAEELGKRTAQMHYDSLEQAFPNVDPNHVPFGSTVLVQLRLASDKTAAGIVLVRETQESDKWNAQVAKVISHGPLAYCNRETREQWPEGPWTKDGDFVRVPKFGGDRFEVYDDKSGERVTFVIFNDLDLRGGVPRPLETLGVF